LSTEPSSTTSEDLPEEEWEAAAEAPEVEEVDTEPEFSSALFDHCVTVYQAMLAKSHQVPEGTLYEGALTGLFNDLGFGVAYYTQVTRKLKAMDCIRQVSRGGGGVPSRWLLLQEPSQALFGLPDKVSKLSATKRSTGVAQQQNRDLNGRLMRVEQYLRSQGAPL
jgi:hypothetical protein